MGRIFAESVSIDGELLLFALVALVLLLVAVVLYLVLGYRIVRRGLAGGATTGTRVGLGLIAALDAFLVVLGVITIGDGGVVYLVPALVHGVAALRGWRARTTDIDVGG